MHKTVPRGIWIRFRPFQDGVCIISYPRALPLGRVIADCQPSRPLVAGNVSPSPLPLFRLFYVCGDGVNKEMQGGEAVRATKGASEK
jgi:hypothetical protein